MKVRFLILFLVTLSVACSSDRNVADLVIRNGTVYTVDSLQPAAEAIAVKGDRIVFVGSNADVEKWIGDSTEVIDVEGKAVTPGFIESHGHFLGVGYNVMNLDLSSAKSYDEIVSRVAEAVAKAQPGEWIVGRGWHQDKWVEKPSQMVEGFQTHHALSAVSPDNPVYLSHASGHAAMANAKAMEIAGVNQLTADNLGPRDHAGGEIIRDKNGNPTGIFNENAMGLVGRHVPPRTPARDSVALKLAEEACLRYGITTFQDAGARQSAIDIYERFRERNDLQIRLYVMVAGQQLARKWFAKGPRLDPEHFLTIRSIKLSCDGALGARGAWLLEPYTDRPGFYGMETTPMDTVFAIARDALRHGFQVCTHAIGDRANREVLDRYERAFNLEPALAKDHRFRVEHAQHLHPTDIPRFASLGVIASMQGIHMASDRPWAIDRLGEKRIVEGAYVWQSLLKTGAKIANGTDAPVEPVNPIPSFYASITRQTLEGTPEGGYEPHERMTREQALRSYTLDAAYAAFMDSVTGSIAEGKLADFIVHSKDIMKVDPAEILNAEVELTVVGGKIRYRK
jgi:predicted amidohydrolase YtcJ